MIGFRLWVLKFSKLALFICIAMWGSFTTPSYANDEEIKQRKWTDASGEFSVDAIFIKVEEHIVSLKRSDGTTIQVPLSKLSAADRAYVRKILKAINKNKTDAKKPNLTLEPAIDVGPPKADCLTCRGSGIAPLETFRPYIQFENKRKPKNAETIGYCACPECQKNKPLDEIEFGLAEIGDDNRHEKLEEQLNRKLRKVETHYYMIHSQVNDKATLAVAQSLEKMQRYLQTKTDSMKLIPVRRQRNEIVLLKSKKEYMRFLEVIKKNRVEASYPIDWSIMEQRHSSWVDQTQFTYDLQPPQGRWLANAVVYTAAYYQIESATNWNSPDWLSTGFGAHNEFVLFGVNICYPVEYKLNDPKLAPDWDKVLSQHARQEKLEKWDALFERKIRDYEAIDYVQCKSMTTSLMSQPKKFLDFIDSLNEGVNQIEALEKSYGESLETLETKWLRKLR